MKDYAATNRTWWNKVTPVHAKSELYNLESFKKGKTSLQTIEIGELGNVKGKKLLHLLCHFGMDTLSWAKKGAVTTGVDLSDSSIKLAKKLSREINVPAKFICSDVYQLPQILDEKFDIIFASYGVLLWLKNIKRFTKIVNHFLADGGIFYIVELHPFTNILSADFKIDYKYFQKGVYIDDSTGTYTDWNADIEGFTYNWNYTLQDIINSFIGEGLKIEFIHEFPYTMYEQFPGFMEKNKKGQYVFKDKKIQIPLLFSLKAEK